MKIVVAHVPAGSGHERAAQAVMAGLIQMNAQVQPLLLNAAQKADRTYQWAFTRGYQMLIDHAPGLWALMYYATDCAWLTSLWRRLHRLQNAWHGKGLEEFLVSAQPDTFVATHFFPVEVAAFLKRSRRISSTVIAVITDYLPHTLWIAPGVDRYIVGFLETKEELIRRGVKAQQISVLGIPIDPKFSQRNDRVAVAQRLGIDPKGCTILIGSGGFGTGPIASLVQSLGRLKEKVQLLIVTGKNASLFKRLSSLNRKIPHVLKIYGFIHNMDELMDVSDLMITKPGGLSCSEALAKGLPLILISPIPGQESRNAQLLSQKQIAAVAPRLSRICQIIERMRRDQGGLSAWAQRAREAARPNAALEIATLATQASRSS